MINKAMILGNLGKDVEYKHTPSGTAVANFTVATSEKYKSREGDQERTEWHRVVAFGNLADLCSQFLRKGSKCHVEGKIQTREYEKDGKRHHITEIIAANVQFLSPKSQGSQDENHPAFDSQDNPY